MNLNKKITLLFPLSLILYELSFYWVMGSIFLPQCRTYFLFITSKIIEMLEASRGQQRQYFLSHSVYLDFKESLAV